MRFIGTGISDIGISKDVNQDSFCIKIADTEFGDVALAIVCDGCGGLSSGEIASGATVEAFMQWFDEKLPVLIQIFGTSQAGFESTLQGQWGGLIQDLNITLLRYGQKNNITLGTTITGLLTIGSRFSCVHIGDSRLYQLHNNEIKILTKDQTFIVREIEAGRMTREEAIIHPKRNTLLQCLGASQVLTPDIFHGDLDTETNFLLCSDGFRHQITNEEIFENLNPEKITTETMIKKNIEYLIEIDKKREEQDNITAVLLRVNGIEE